MVKNLEELFIQSKNPSIVWITAKFIEDKIGGQYYSTDYIEYERILNTNKLTVLKDVVFEYNGGPMGFQLHSYDYVDQGIPVLRTKDMKELTIILDDPIFILREKHNELKGSKTYSGDIIISKTGQIGVVAVVPKTLSEANLNQALCNIRVKESVIDNYFLVVFLNSKYCQYQFIRQGEGKAVQNGLTKDEILDLRIPVISSEIQKYIGDKVRKAEELREEAKRLKKEAEETIYKKLGNIELEDEKNYTVNFIKEKDIFERIDSEYYKEKYFRLQKQLESKGFVLKTLDKLCDSNIYNGKTYKTTNEKRKYMNIGVGELGDWFIVGNEDKYIDENISTKHLIDKYSIVWGNSAHLAKYIGEKVNINLEMSLYVPTTEITCIKPNLDKINQYYLFLYMKSNWGYYQIQRTVKGMTAHSYPQDISRIIVPILDFNFEELDIMKNAVELGYNYINKSKQLIKEAKQDVEDLIEGNFDMSKIKINN